MKQDKQQLVTVGLLEETLDLAFAKFFGQLVTYLNLDKRFEEKADKAQVEHLITSIDGLAKRVDDDAQDRALNDAQLQRHGRWIGELSANTGTQLSPPQ
jgi:hypothetical protein